MTPITLRLSVSREGDAHARVRLQHEDPESAASMAPVEATVPLDPPPCCPTWRTTPPTVGCSPRPPWAPPTYTNASLKLRLSPPVPIAPFG